jgi:hypothetical protein
VTFEGPGQPEQNGERRSPPDLLGFLSDFRAASAPIPNKLSSEFPETETSHPDADPMGTHDRPADLLSSGSVAPAIHVEPDPPVPTWYPDSSADPGPVAFPPPLAPRGVESGWAPPSARRGVQSDWAPPPPPGAAPQGGPPLPYATPAPYGNALPYSYPPAGSRLGRGRIIGIIAASVVGLILVALAIPTLLGSRGGLHPAFTPAGYKAFTDKTDRFTLAVPGSWESVDPSSPGAAEAFQQLQADNPAFESVEGGDVSNLASRGMKFLAVGDQSSVNVVVKPFFGAAGSALTQLQSQVPSLYQSLGATLLSNDLVQLNGREALQASVEQPFNEPNGSRVIVDEIQDFYVANDLVYSVTLSGDSTDLTTIGSTFSIGS